MRKYSRPNLNDVTLEEFLYALGDPVRLGLVRALFDQEERLSCSEVAAKMNAEDMPPSTCNHHLGILREAGVICSKRSGVRVESCLRKDDIENRFPGLLQALLRYK